jgi:hypothetical protein
MRDVAEKICKSRGHWRNRRLWDLRHVFVRTVSVLATFPLAALFLLLGGMLLLLFVISNIFICVILSFSFA